MTHPSPAGVARLPSLIAALRQNRKELEDLRARTPWPGEPAPAEVPEHRAHPHGARAGRPSCHEIADAVTRAYLVEQEELILEQLRGALQEHPAAVWVDRVEWVPAPLGAQLLVRLGPALATSNSPLRFWNLCGLNQAIRARFECEVCDLGLAHSAPRGNPARHNRLGTSTLCSGRLHPVPPSAAAKPALDAERGREYRYDVAARYCCREIAEILASRPGGYRRFFRSRRAEAPMTSVGARQYSALMDLQKLFLEHLWTAWRRALGLPLAHGFPGIAAGYGVSADPWSMATPGPRRTRAAQDRPGSAGAESGEPAGGLA